ncbi:caspase family protein [Catellatospora sichuanensis]|uniref:caspase family protein n=1 Tax=Catellatospora sichuanensis TaxID=1969805 RepID=UPI001182E18B|nr:caspase family protein [Catellatospora sichuanensis]
MSFLPELAQDLARVLVDPGLGGCEPALDVGPVLIDPSRTGLMQAVRAAFTRANDGDGSVLVLAFIGHGIAVDEDFYFLPADGSGRGHFDADVHVSQLLKEGLRDNPNLDGLLVLLDTCHAGVGAAQAAAWQQVGLGRRTHRYELLTSSADQPAYGGVVTRTMIEVLRAGITTAGTTIGSRHLHSFLRDEVVGQRPQRITHDGGGWANPDDEGLWWAHNAGHYSRRSEPAVPAGYVVPARSAYRLQVAQIAPEHLYDRDQETADMAAFCTMPDADSYRYWRAGPWAGKSALMSWFALHPPAGVNIVSFFITARYAGQSDRVAFTEVVVGQLAELLDEPMPVLTDATREFTFLYLLAQAGKRCEARGERLVLLVDGLDEDRGVTTGPDAHSIAALLPERPSHGVRIIVAGRPNPPVPDDVPPGHPLYDKAVIFPLTPSAQARVVQKDMQRELSHLLNGSPAEQDLLGLLTAAVGGLSARDLAELTGQLPWQVEEHLATVAGRSFNTRGSQWRPGQEPDVYVLGHEELQKTATGRIGPLRLNDNRQRLHAWADTYQTRNWPPTTPEYLLRGYYRLLASIGDLTRLVALSTDTARHDRMLDLSGGDTAALTEITTIQTLLLAQPEPDLEVMALLSIRRKNLTDRNTNIPAGLPAVWAHLGQPARAEALARSISDPRQRAQALTAATRAAAASGDPDRAEQIARSVTDPYLRAQALTAATESAAASGDPDQARRLAADAEQAAWSVTNPYLRAQALTAATRAAAASGDPDRAEQIARSVTDPGMRAQALTAATESAAASGDPDQARRLAADAEQAAWSVTNPNLRAQALTAATKAAAASGDRDQAWRLAADAEQAARSFTDLGMRAQALTAAAEAAAAVGDLDRARRLAADAEHAARSSFDQHVKVQALTAVAEAAAASGDLDRARRLAADAEQTARSVTNPYAQAHALTAAAEAAAAVGDPDRARRLAADAEQAARSFTDPYVRAQALTAVAEAAAAVGDPDRARRLAADAEQAARSITDPYVRAQALTAVAVAAAASGDLDQARRLAADAEQAAKSIINPDLQAYAPTAVAKAAAASGDPDRAEQIARSVTDPGMRAQALTAVAVAAAASGDPDQARRLAADAEQTARSVTNPYLRAQALTAATKAAAASGDPDRAEQIARSVTDPGMRAQALTAATESAAASGDPDQARRLAADAEQAARSFTDPYVRAQALTAATKAAAASGDPDQARRLAADAERAARTITNPNLQGQALTAVAEIVGPQAACRLLGEAFAMGHWWSPLSAVARVAPQVVLRIADLMLR